MNKLVANTKLGWLSVSLANRRSNVAALLARLRGFGVKIGASLGLQKKFLRLMDQIAYEREREVEILNEIENVEKLHLHFKKRKMLRHASPFSSDTKPPQADVPAPRRSGLLALIGFFLLLAPKPIKHKKQDLTID